MQALPAVVAMALMGLLAVPQPQLFDVVIANGTIVDGTGAPSRVGSVGVRAGVVVRIGEVPTSRAGAVIDARGQVVAPGLIAVLATEDPVASFPGVTTVIAGARGASAIDIAEHLDQLDAAGTVVNYATLLGHSSIRFSVMGRVDRSPSVSELQRMKALVFRAMADGAFGFSTDLTGVPGRYAQEPEVVELARVSANEDGVFVTYAPDEDVINVEAARQAIKIGMVAGMPVRISRQRAGESGPLAGDSRVGDLIDVARRRGLDVDVTADEDAAALLERIRAAVRRGERSVEEAIGRATARPARQFGLKDRGEIRVGAAADLLIFDPDQLSGVSYLLVNGVVTVRNDVAGRETAGQVIRHHR